MRVLLISANTEKINLLLLPLGLGCVAAAVRDAGHEVRMLDLMSREDGLAAITKTVEDFRPEVIGISVRNIDDQVMRELRFLLDQARQVVNECRSATQAPIVLGGAGFSIFPEPTLEYLQADMGIQGEGETVFPMLLDRLRKGMDVTGIPGLYLKGRGVQGRRTFTQNLDELPFPELHISPSSAPVYRESWMPVQSRRGCPMNCSYCSTGTIEGLSIRKRSPGLVVRDIARHVDSGFRKFHFVDNTFNLPLPYAKELCRRLTESGLKISWMCILYPGKVDEELIGLMAGAGCAEVSLGFESGCDRILKNMNKKYRAGDIRRASEMLKNAGIRRMGFLLLGGPGETAESAGESLAFADSLDLEALKLTVGVRIYPGTALAETALREGMISPDDDLLFPRFYLAGGLEDRLRAMVKDWMDSHPNWIG